MNAETQPTTANHSNPWAMWLNFYNVFHSWQVEWCHMWGHHQLEMPDALAESKEPELFA